MGMYRDTQTQDVVQAGRHDGAPGQQRVAAADVWLETGDWWVILPGGAVTGYTDAAFAERFASLAPPARTLTKLAFRRRFTLAERIAVDAAPENVAFDSATRAALRTMAADLAMAEEVDLDDADVIAGVQLLVALGLLTSGRAAEILG